MESTDQSLYREIFLSSENAAMVLSANGDISQWNPAATSLYGYEKSEAVGKNLSFLYPPGGSDEISLLMDQVAAEIKSSLDTQHKRKDDCLIDVHLNISPLKVANGKIGGASVIARNITEEKRMAKQQIFIARSGALLSSSLNYHQTLKNIANLAVPQIADWCVIDVLDKQGRMERVALTHSPNTPTVESTVLQQKYTQIMSNEYGVGKVLLTKKPEFYPHVTNKLIKEVAENEEQYQLLKKFGLTSVIIVPLLYKEDVFGTITLISTKASVHYSDLDLQTSQELARRAAVAIENARLFEQIQTTNTNLESIVKERTKELNAINEKLVLSNQDLSDFAHVASHDLQEPLRKIQAFSEMLQRKYEKEGGDDSLMYLERIQDAVSRMRRLVNDILYFSRVATQNKPFKHTNLNEIVDGVLQDLELSISESEAEIDVKRCPQLMQTRSK